MKFVKQFCIIIAISFIGELFGYIIPLPIPASIYGLVIMLLCLVFKIIPLEAVKDTGRFLIEIMPIMFIPSSVGLIDSWGTLKPQLLPITVITVVSTVLVMGISGRVTQAIIRRTGKKKKSKTEEVRDEQFSL